MARNFLKRRYIGDALGLALTLAGIAATIIRVLRPTNLQQDFAYIYVAGRAWLSGLDPYTPDFLRVSRSLFYDGGWPKDWFFPPESWVYPPQWSVIGMPLGLFSFPAAALLWQLIAGVSIVASVVILWRCADTLDRPPPLLLKGIFAFLVMTGEAAHWNIWLGQTGAFVLLGFALALYGIARGSRPLLALGLFVLLLKPQLGLAFFLIALWEKEQRSAAIAAGAATLLGCAIAVAATGIGEIPQLIHGYLQNLQLYVASAPNTPQAMTGIGQLFYYLGLPALPGPAYPFVAAAAGVAMLHVGTRLERKAYVLRYWAVALTLMALMPSHGNDLMALTSILLLLRCMDLFGASCAIVAAAILYRPADVFRWAAPKEFDFSFGARIEAVAAVFLIVAVYRTFASSRAASGPLRSRRAEKIEAQAQQ